MGISHATFLKRVHDTIKHYDMLTKGDRVLVAVSGGPDSVCLLLALSALAGKTGVEIVVVNMDHGIRGKDSRADSLFVKRLAEKLGLRCAHKALSLRNAPRKGRSLEEAAREKRYAFFAEAAQRTGCNVIATGHTMDDQAETVLLRALTGSSFASLAGIPPVRRDGGLKIIRPLIRTEKKDILDHLAKKGAPFVTDSTNLDTAIRRNRVRLDIMPVLESFNPRVRRALANLADSVREDTAYIMMAKEEGKALLSGKSGKAGKTAAVPVNIADLVLQPVVLRKAIFKEAVNRLGGNIKKLTYRHWMDVDYLLRAGGTGKSLDLPGNIRVTKRKKELVFERQ